MWWFDQGHYSTSECFLGLVVESQAGGSGFYVLGSLYSSCKPFGNDHI